MPWTKKFSAMLRAVAGMCLLFSVGEAHSQEIALYVSPDGNDGWSGRTLEQPVATLDRARNLIDALKQSGGLTQPVTVYIRGGVYEFDKTLVFTSQDSGTRTCPITYRAYKNEKPVIRGSRRIVGPWEHYRGNIQVCSIPTVCAGRWQFRQLFVNDKRQQRAKAPNDNDQGEDTFYRIADTDEDHGRDALEYVDGHFKDWKNLTGVEVVILHSYNESILRVAELYEDENIVTFTGPVGRRLGMGERRSRYYIENALELLDRPGEWYLDRHLGKLYLWPTSDLDQAEVRGPVLNELIRFEGDIEGKRPVQFVHFRGLTFADTDYVLPTEGIPTIRDVGDIWFPAAITLKGALNCRFEDNTLRNVGTYAIDVTGDGNQIIGNTIYDAGGGGIITRSYGKHRNVISYNHVHHCGSIFASAVGINIDDGGGLIANNLVHDISQSGIYARYTPSDYGQAKGRRNQEQGLIIEYNEVYDVMQRLNDGAGIFVRDDYIVIRNNLVHDVYPHPEGHGAPAWGIYLGCDTRNCLVEFNVVYRTYAGQHIWHGNINNTMYNNIFVDGARAQHFYNNPTDRRHPDHETMSHVNFRLLRNIICFSGPDAVLYSVDQEKSVPSESDYNIIYHTEGKPLVIRGLDSVKTFDDWKKRGLDVHSIVADPLFTDPANDDYTLRPDSPAFELGFKPIDLSNVGLRGQRQE